MLSSINGAGSIRYPSGENCILTLTSHYIQKSIPDVVYVKDKSINVFRRKHGEIYLLPWSKKRFLKRDNHKIKNDRLYYIQM